MKYFGAENFKAPRHLDIRSLFWKSNNKFTKQSHSHSEFGKIIKSSFRESSMSKVFYPFTEQPKTEQKPQDEDWQIEENYLNLWGYLRRRYPNVDLEDKKFLDLIKIEYLEDYYKKDENIMHNYIEVLWRGVRAKTVLENFP